MDSDLLSIADARDCALRTRAAFEIFRRFDQQSVDRVCAAMVDACAGEAERLARLAVDETGIGTVEGKTAKNLFSCQSLWERVGTMHTCGIISEDDERGVWEVADPFGVVAGIIPTTNPTSTAMFKAIICLKSRNGMVVSPHPRASGCIQETIRICHDAAVAAGAPRDILTCMVHVNLDGTRSLLNDENVSLILATGGSALVRAAYSSGKPAFGVGPGNTPAYVDRSADVADAALCLIESQTFDNATICSSEQSILCDTPVVQELKSALLAGGAHWCTPEEVRSLEKLAIRRGVTNPEIVGLAPQRIAEMAGFQVPETTTVLVAPCTREQVGSEHPLSQETLCPILAFYVVDGFEEGCRLSIELLNLGGRGHTLALHCHDESIIRAFALEKPVNRLLINSPTSQGAVGLSTNLFPSMTLGCGSFGGNITSDNIGPQHLLNIKRVGWVKRDWRSEAASADGSPSAPEAAKSPWDREQDLATPAPSPPGRSNVAPGDPDPVLRQEACAQIENPGTLGADLARSPGKPPSLMGNPGRPLPGEHFSDEDLARIVQDALARRVQNS